MFEFSSGQILRSFCLCTTSAEIALSDQIDKTETAIGETQGWKDTQERNHFFLCVFLFFIDTHPESYEKNNWYFSLHMRGAKDERKRATESSQDHDHELIRGEKNESSCAPGGSLMSHGYPTLSPYTINIYKYS